MSDALVRKLQESLAKGSLSAIGKRQRAELKRFLVLDCSGSMADYCEPGRAKIDALRDIVASLRASGTVFRQIVFGGFGALVDDTLPDPSGSTPMHLAFDLARAFCPGRVVIVSDGMPDVEGLAMHAAKELRCPIDIFYVGPRPHSGEAFLRGLARAAGGQYQATTLTRDGTKAIAEQAKRLLALPARAGS